MKLKQLQGFLQKRGVTHLLDDQGADFDVEGRILDAELGKIIRKSTAEETTDKDVLYQRGICQDQNMFTITRRRGVRSGFHIPYGDKLAFSKGERVKDEDAKNAGALRPLYKASPDAFRWLV